MNIPKIKRIISEGGKQSPFPIKENYKVAPLLTAFDAAPIEAAKALRSDVAEMKDPFNAYRFAINTPAFGLVVGAIMQMPAELIALIKQANESFQVLGTNELEKLESSPAGFFRMEFNGKDVWMYIGFDRPVCIIDGEKQFVPESEFKELSDIWSDIIIMFRYLYVYSGMHIARVTKSDPRRTVQFYQKHEYWTTVARVHPANDASVKSGSEVKLTEEQIKRCAHHRRAHYRILRSERFKNARGKKVFVKSCWVGPEEWREGNQIYRIQPNAQSCGAPARQREASPPAAG